MKVNKVNVMKKTMQEKVSSLPNVDKYIINEAIEIDKLKLKLDREISVLIYNINMVYNMDNRWSNRDFRKAGIPILEEQ